jgi:hypothetical protein
MSCTHGLSVTPCAGCVAEIERLKQDALVFKAQRDALKRDWISIVDERDRAEAEAERLKARGDGLASDLGHAVSRASRMEALLVRWLEREEDPEGLGDVCTGATLARETREALRALPPPISKTSDEILRRTVGEYHLRVATEPPVKFADLCKPKKPEGEP